MRTRGRGGHRSFSSRGPTACSRGLISDGDPFRTQGRETAAASNCYFRAAPGAPASAPYRGIRPPWLLPGFRRFMGRTKAKGPAGLLIAFLRESRGKRLGEPARDRAVMSNPTRRPQRPALPSRYELGSAEPGKRRSSLPPRSPGRPEPPPWGREGAEWAPRRGGA